MNGMKLEILHELLSEIAGAAIAALDGATRFKLNKVSMHIVSKGDNALALGGYRCDTEIFLTNADSSVNLVTKANYMSFIDKDKITIEGGRARIVINDNEIRNE